MTYRTMLYKINNVPLRPVSDGKGMSFIFCSLLQDLATEMERLSTDLEEDCTKCKLLVKEELCILLYVL